MAQDHRDKSRDQDWGVQLTEAGGALSVEGAQLAVLMDIRDELRRMRRVLECKNFQAMPNLLRLIERHVRRKPKLRVVKRRRAA